MTKIINFVVSKIGFLLCIALILFGMSKGWVTPWGGIVLIMTLAAITSYFAFKNNRREP